MKENNVGYNDELTNKEDNEQILVYDLVGDQALRYSEKDELSSPEIIIIDVKDCKTAKEVFSKLSTQDIFVKDEDNDNVLCLKDSNKKIFWLKVDDKLYIKFDSYIQLDDSFLSSNQYRIKDNTLEEKKTMLPVVNFATDCIRIVFCKLNDDGILQTDDSKSFLFHKNNNAKNIGKLCLYRKGKSVFRTKENESINTLYSATNTFLSNIGNAYYYRPLYLPVSLCGINVMKDEFGGSLCLCGTGCCSPYDIIDEKESMNLKNDIFPLFDLNDTNNKNEEKIV